MTGRSCLDRYYVALDDIFVLTMQLIGMCVGKDPIQKSVIVPAAVLYALLGQCH